MTMNMEIDRKTEIKLRGAQPRLISRDPFGAKEATMEAYDSLLLLAEEVSDAYDPLAGDSAKLLP